MPVMYKTMKLYRTAEDFKRFIFEKEILIYIARSLNYQMN